MRSILFHVPAWFVTDILFWLWLAACVVIVGVSWRRQGWSAETKGYLLPMAVVAGLIRFVFPLLVQGDDGLPIRGYGVLLLAGIVSAVLLAVQRARQRGIDPEHIYSLAFWVVACGLVGARAYYVIKAWPEFQRPTLVQTILAIVNIPEGGLVVYGSLFGAVIAIAVYVYRHRLPILVIADITAPSMMVGLALGRIGCFLNGCCFGGTCDAPWALTFPWQSPPFVQHVDQGLIYLHGVKFAADEQGHPVVSDVEPNSLAAAQGLAPGQRIVMVQGLPATSVEFVKRVLLSTGPGDEVSLVTAGDPTPRHWALNLPAERSLPIHPAQLYAALGATLVLFLLLAIEPYRQHDGELFAIFLIAYPVLRFSEELLRRDEPTIAGLKLAQWISVALFVAGLTLLAFLRTRRKETLPQLQVSSN